MSNVTVSFIQRASRHDNKTAGYENLNTASLADPSNAKKEFWIAKVK